MSIKTIAILGGLIALSIGVVVLSSLAFDPGRGNVIVSMISPAPDRFEVPAPPSAVPFVSRFGPFGRYASGARGIVSAFSSYLFVYLAGAAAAFLVPRPLRVIRDAIRRGPKDWPRFLGIGVLCGLGFVLMTALGVFTVAGFPLAALLLPLLIVVAWVGLVALSLALGKAITRAAGLAAASPLVDLAVGSLIVFALGQVPIIGWGVTAVLAAIALGAVVDTRFGALGGWSLAAFDETD
jgi:hypothetical protein